MGALKQLLIDVHERFYCGDADARDALIELGDPLGLGSRFFLTQGRYNEIEL